MGALQEKLRLFAHFHGQHFLVFFGFRRPTGPVHTPVARSHGQHFMEYFGFRRPTGSVHTPKEESTWKGEALPPAYRETFGKLSVLLGALAMAGLALAFVDPALEFLVLLGLLAPVGLLLGLIGIFADQRPLVAAAGFLLNVPITSMLVLTAWAISTGPLP